MNIENISSKIYEIQTDIINCNLDIIAIDLNPREIPTVHITEDSFRKHFDSFKVIRRVTDEYPYELSENIGQVKFFCITKEDFGYES